MAKNSEGTRKKYPQNAILSELKDRYANTWDINEFIKSTPY